MSTFSCLTSRYVCSVYTMTLKVTTSFSQGTSSGKTDSTESVILLTPATKPLRTHAMSLA